MSDDFRCGYCGESSAPSEFDDADVRKDKTSIDIRCPQCREWTEQPLTGRRRRRSSRGLDGGDF